MNQSSGKKQMVLSNWVIWKEFNKGTVCKGVGRVYESQQLYYRLKDWRKPLLPRRRGIWIGLLLIEAIASLSDLVGGNQGIASFSFHTDLLLVPPVDPSQLEAKRLENLPAQKARWSMNTEGQMVDNLAQIGIIISTF